VSTTAPLNKLLLSLYDSLTGILHLLMLIKKLNL
jgi:hypothetical protein